MPFMRGGTTKEKKKQKEKAAKKTGSGVNCTIDGDNDKRKKI